MEQNLTTLTHPYLLARNETEAADTLLDLTASGNFGNRPSGVINIVDVEPRKLLGGETKTNSIYFIFGGGTAALKTFSLRLLAWKDGNGPAEIVCQGDGVLGTQALVKYPIDSGGDYDDTAATNMFWADTINIDDDRIWLKIVKAINPTNSVAKLWVGDTCGYKYWYPELYDIHGGGNQAQGIVSYWGYW